MGRSSGTCRMKSAFRAAVLAALLTALALPTAAETVLRVVPHAGLRNFDPIWTTAYITRNHGYMVYDTLFATDAELKPQPQMVESWTVSDDRLTWTFRLRDGLFWHDGAPVTAEDCVASLRRWAARDSMGRQLFAQLASIDAPDARTIRLALARPYGLVLESLGKISSNVPFMMPKRLAETDPFQQVSEIVGSGPFMFKKDEFVPGVKVVYVRNPDYRPRPEPPSATAGGKRAKVDRVEWIYIPDATTAMNALMAGEVDFWELVPPDLAPILAEARDVKVEVLDRVGSLAILRFNTLLPPFDKPEIRRAVLKGLDQEDFLLAAIGNPDFFKLCDGVFPCGTPFASQAGLDLIRPVDAGAARAAIRAAGYKGEKVVLLHPTDYATHNGFAAVAVQKLRALGLNVEDQTMDWASVTSRRAKKEPLDQGGWSVFPTSFLGVEAANPVSFSVIGGEGPNGWFGWLEDHEIEAMRTTFALSTDPAEQTRLAEAVQRRAIELGAFVNLGTFFIPVAYRSAVDGVIRSPVPIYWNISVKR